MTDIKNTEQLHTEINRLRTEINNREHRIREHVSAFKESLKPMNLVLSGFKNIFGTTTHEHDKSFVRETIKTGLLLLMGKLLFRAGEKTEKRVSSIVDTVFDGIRNFVEKRRRKKKENSFYKFEDEYDSESN